MISVLKGNTTAWIGIVLAVAVLLLLGHVARPVVYLSNDVDLYQKIAENAWTGSDMLKSEYPPLATALFAMVDPPAFPPPFPDVWRAFILLASIGAAVWAAVRFSARDALGILLSISATMLLLGFDVTWGRYDILVGILLLMTWLAHRHEKYAASGLLLMIAAALKLVPFALFPLLFLATPNKSRRSLVWGTLGGVTFATALPFLILGTVGTIENILYMSVYHSSRGVQLESTWSGLTIFTEMLHGDKATMLFANGVHENIEVPKFIHFLSIVLVVAGLAGVYWQTARKRSGDLALPFLAALSWLIAVSTVLSPQYAVWILPLILFWSVERLFEKKQKNRCMVICILAIGCAIALLTHWLYPNRYEALLDQKHIFPVLVLNLRNALFFALTGICYFASTSKSRSTSAG
ncbi:MAG: DUF2029 domain-containing protein [Candidatus Peribacteraceae bacterium]|nr:DUF2029 domain-containing protein [Candidatus Peribacteraceae bacterium]